MWFMSTAIIGADTVGQLVSRQQSLRLDYGPFAMHPLRLNRVQPGTLRGQQAQHNPHASLALFDLAIVGAYPAAHRLADVPRSIVPNQQQGGLAGGGKPIAAPAQEVDRHAADRSPIDKSQQHTIGGSGRRLSSRLAHQQAVAGQRLGISVVLELCLLNHSDRRIIGLPGVNISRREPAPPDFVTKAQRPLRLAGRQAD